MEKATVERSLDASIKDGAAYAVMVGLGETYVAACALFLGASQSSVAYLVTIAPCAGAVTQILTSWFIERTGRRRRWFLLGAAVQALAWFPMVASLWAPRPAGFWLLFAGFSLYFASVHFTVPAWLSVMGDLVPSETRGRFFGRRNALALSLQFAAATLGGVGLTLFEKAGHERLGFAVVFSAALVARIVSVAYLTRMAEPPYTPRDEDRFTLWQFVARLPKSNFARFVFFVAFLNASANFVGALFVPYWRETLQYSYSELAATLTAVVVIQVPALLLWGRVADRYGNKKVLTVASFGIAALPAMWLLSRHVAWAVFMQMWSGFFWSGFHQSVANFLLDAVSPAKRARCAAYLNLIANFGMLAGGLVGAWAITVIPSQIGPIALPYPFWTMLLVSTALRALTLVIFLPRFREVRDVPQIGVAEMLFHSTREITESAVNLMSGQVPRADDKKK